MIRLMQTFMPYPDFARTAGVLDQKRLGKQRVECIQVIRALTVPGYGWGRHPAARMWCGWLEALGSYSLAVCEEWQGRGFSDTCAATIRADLLATGLREVRTQRELAAADELPTWLGEEAFHRSHRSALLTKDPLFYGEVFGGEEEGQPYVWPAGRPGSVCP
jgi:GNAT superfamily N-acetyltransferase